MYYLKMSFKSEGKKLIQMKFLSDHREIDREDAEKIMIYLCCVSSYDTFNLLKVNKDIYIISSGMRMI